MGPWVLINARWYKSLLVIGAGPAGLEYARVAAARGHNVTVLEKEDETGGHARLQSLLPSRSEYGEIGHWLTRQARKNGADIRLSSPVDDAGLDALLGELTPDHVIVATGSRVSVDGFQGWTGEPLPGWESANCIGWDEVVVARQKSAGVSFPGHVVVLDDMCDVVAPLTAVALTESGAASVRLVTRWPMVGMETILDFYLDWILPKLYEAGVEMMVDRFVRSIDGNKMTLYNVHYDKDEIVVDADWIVMATSRRSENGLYAALTERGVSVETIGDATAPRGTYEAVYEGHRAARSI